MKLRTLAYNDYAPELWVTTLPLCGLKGVQTTYYAPDAVSRHPISAPAPQDMLAEVDILNQPEPLISEIRAANI